MKEYKVLILPGEKVCFQQANDVALDTFLNFSAYLSWVLLPHKGI